MAGRVRPSPMHGLADLWLDLAIVIAMTVVAIALFALNPRHRAFQLFSFVLALRAVTWFPLALAHGAWTSAVRDRVLQVAEPTLTVTVVAFALVYPRRRALARHAWVWWLLGLAAVGIAAWALLRPDAFLVNDTDPVRWGPAYMLTGGLQQALYVGLGLLFARDVAHARTPALATGLCLVALGWTLRGAKIGGWGILHLVSGEPFFAETAWPLLLDALLVACLVGTLAVMWTFAQTAATAGPTTRRALRVANVMLVVALLAGVISFPLSGRLVGGVEFETLLDAVVILALPLLVAYALARHAVFDLDARFKWTLRQSTVAGLFIAVFFVVSELAASVLSDQLGTVAGIVAAGALVFAIVPIQRWASRLSDAAMPGVVSRHDLEDADRARLYEEAVTTAWADGQLSRDERLLLDQLRDSLALPHDVVLEIESAAAQRAPVTRTGADASR